MKNAYHNLQGRQAHRSAIHILPLHLQVVALTATHDHSLDLTHSYVTNTFYLTDCVLRGATATAT